MDEGHFAVTLSRRQNYEFGVAFDEGYSTDLILDEPPPLGAGHGPNASRVLGVALGHCLAASLLFCLGKARVAVADLGVRVEGTTGRNEAGRLRITDLKVTLTPAIGQADRERINRCLTLFEDFCIVTASVRQGIPVHVEVAPIEVQRGAEAP
jgi:organic hydroperoxide reductase OsmC/OhrA